MEQSVEKRTGMNENIKKFELLRESLGCPNIVSPEAQGIDFTEEGLRQYAELIAADARLYCRNSCPMPIVNIREKVIEQHTPGGDMEIMVGANLIRVIHRPGLHVGGSLTNPYDTDQIVRRAIASYIALGHINIWNVDMSGNIKLKQWMGVKLDGEDQWAGHTEAFVCAAILFIAFELRSHIPVRSYERAVFEKAVEEIVSVPQNEVNEGLPKAIRSRATVFFKPHLDIQ